MKLILQHPTGNSFVRATTKGFLEANLIEEFHTSIASYPGSVLNILSFIKPFSEIKRRSYYPGLKSITHSNPWLEIGRQIALKGGFSWLTKHETGIFSVDAVYRNLDKFVASRLKNLSEKGVNGVYAYEDGAVNSFTEAKKYGMNCFYDLPIGYWKAARRLLQVEREKWPEWAPTLTSLIDSDIKLERKDDELRKADLILVASTFTAYTLEDFLGSLAPVKVIPYGFPDVNNNRHYEKIYNRRLKLLFVGSLSQRKGIADVFSIADKFANYVDLTIVGGKVVNNCKPLEAALKKHTWIPTLPHNEILRLMRQHDVLIFPSLFEGFGLVISEAMSQGTPVITTNRTAGPDIIEHGENGWIIDAGSRDGLETIIDNLLVSPGLIQETGEAALNSARKRPWEVYGKELAEAVANSELFLNTANEFH